jgi:hypothetical protein
LEFLSKQKVNTVEQSRELVVFFRYGLNSVWPVICTLRVKCPNSQEGVGKEPQFTVILEKNQVGKLFFPF